METIIITAIFFLLSILLTIVITKHYSSRSELNIIIASILDLVRISSDAKDKIKVLYNNEEVKSLSVIRLVIENQGNNDISEDQVKVFPSLRFINNVKIINVDEISKGNKSNVQTKVIGDNEIQFHFKFLSRKNKCAFQILVHNEEGFTTSIRDLSFYEGVIKNTRLKFTNYDVSDLPSMIARMNHFIQTNYKAITVVYSLISFILFSLGVFMLINLVFPNTVKLIDSSNRPTIENILSVILLWFLSFFLIAPILVAYRRIRYRMLFSKRIN
jgi:hypothetical protein